jgi:NACalpha-BTF3-like transcription factor
MSADIENMLAQARAEAFEEALGLDHTAIDERAREERKKAGYTVTPQDVTTLRNKTGAGMNDCAESLRKTGGDLTEAAEYLRTKGHAVNRLNPKAAR